jgi:hypothetical protein
MSRSHGYRFANDVLPETLFDNSLAFARAVTNQRQGLQLLASAWDRAGATMPAADRAGRAGLTASIQQRGAYGIILVSVPPPREAGDPAMIVIVGSGDGESRYDVNGYFILELGADTRYHVVSRTAHSDQATTLGVGPAPDAQMFIDHVCGSVVPPRIPSVPAYYYWHAFDGAGAMRAWLDTRDPLSAIAQHPILLLPEIAESASVYLTGGATAEGLLELRHQLMRDPAFGPAAHGLALLLVNARTGVVAANLARAIKVVAEASEYGADRAQGYAIEADIRHKLAVLGIETRANYEAAQRLRAMAQAPQNDVPLRPRMARGSHSGIPQDPSFATLFLDGSELPYFTRGELTDLDAGHALAAASITWTGRDDWAMSRIIDSRWSFATAAEASQFLQSAQHAIGDGLPQLPAPQLAEETLAYGGPRAAQIIVFRVGRTVGRLAVAQGHAAPDTLEQAMLLPYAQRAVQRAQWNLSRYWLNVGCGTDAATLFVQTPNARLLADYPILALPEFPAAMATLGGAYVQGAQQLWQLQTQLRGQQWQAHRTATQALVRTLLDDRTSDPRVNAAHAHAIVDEIRRLDSDPIWIQLAAECRTRA